MCPICWGFTKHRPDCPKGDEMSAFATAIPWDIKQPFKVDYSPYGTSGNGRLEIKIGHDHVIVTDCTLDQLDELATKLTQASIDAAITAREQKGEDIPIEAAAEVVENPPVPFGPVGADIDRETA